MAELYLFEADKKVDELVWQADRNLANELLPSIQKLLLKNEIDIEDLRGIIVFTGTGSFTGLRIGTTVANALAYTQSIPIVEVTGEKWIMSGLKSLGSAKVGDYIVPKYSSEPNITKPK